MELARHTGRSSGGWMGDRWRVAGARAWRAVVASGISRAASQLDVMTRHFGTAQPALASELRGAADWARSHG